MKVIGYTVGTTLPKPSLKQSDPTKGDYIKDKDALDNRYYTEEEMDEFLEGLWASLDDKETVGAADNALLEANQYTDGKIALLMNNSSEAVDSIMELATAMQENDEVVGALEEAIGKKANAGDLTFHTGDKSNPHEVTKAQVGLGNVPNVATNDQTPTYSEATTLANLTSGEKLSISLGKIMKAIKDFISHKVDTTVHITSDERTKWNAAKTHADSDHAPSDAEKNVQSDWNESNSNSDAFIKNKPTIPTTASDVGAVPTSRKVNGKALSTDISLTASDVGAATASDITNAINALDSTVSAESGKYISAITQTDGKITATKASLPSLSGGSATTNDATVVGGVTVNGHTVTVDKKTLKAGSNVSITGGTKEITIAATDTKYEVVSTTANGLAPQLDGNTMHFLRGDGQWSSTPIYSSPNATTTSSGYMSAEDKRKLNGIDTNANNYTHPDNHPASMITGLATVATSGSYNDLSNKPTVTTVTMKSWTSADI